MRGRILYAVALVLAGGSLLLPALADDTDCAICHEEVVDAFRSRFDVTVETVETAQETVEFKVPRVLRIPA